MLAAPLNGLRDQIAHAAHQVVLRERLGHYLHSSVAIAVADCGILEIAGDKQLFRPGRSMRAHGG